MDDHIENYIDERFNPSVAAQKFFASYGENEIGKKLTDMGKLQQSIENILKQNVRDNYHTFLQVNDQIGQVGQEMSDLKHLIENTRKLINDVRGTRLYESRAMRSNSLLPILQQKLVEQEKRKEERAQAQTAVANIPVWLTRASDELIEHIVEQQYQKAVAIVLKSRSYVESMEKLKSSSGSESSTNSKALEALRKVNERGAHLADTIKKSLLTLPNSPLWGMTEQYKRLKLLIALEEYEIAGEGFSLIKQQHIQRALSSVDFSSNIIAYARDLSKSFLTELLSSVKTYFQLFEDQLDDLEILSILLEWTQSQTSDFIRFFCRQLHVAVAESSALMLLYLRDPAVISRTAAAGQQHLSASPTTSGLPTNNTNDASKTTPTRQGPKLVRLSTLRHASMANAPNNATSAGQTHHNNQHHQSSVAPIGGMMLTSQSIVEILAHALDYEDALQAVMIELAGQLSGGGGSGRSSVTVGGRRASFSGLITSGTIVGTGISVGSSNSSSTGGVTATTLSRPFPMIATCSFYLLPEVRRLFADHCEEIINEVAHQVRQDAWTTLATTNVEICGLLDSHRHPQVSTSASVDSNNTSSTIPVTDVSPSYLWMIAAFNHLIGEILIMLNKRSLLLGAHSNTSHTDASSATADIRSTVLLGRFDVSELEPAAVNVLLRLLVRFLVEIEALDASSFTRAQAHCFNSTVDAIDRHLVRSLQDWVDRIFVAERMQLLPTPPSTVFRTVRQRLNRLRQSLDIGA